MANLGRISYVKVYKNDHINWVLYKYISYEHYD